MLSLTGFHSLAVRVRLLLPQIFSHNWKTWASIWSSQESREERRRFLSASQLSLSSEVLIQIYYEIFGFISIYKDLLFTTYNALIVYLLIINCIFVITFVRTLCVV